MRRLGIILLAVVLTLAAPSARAQTGAPYEPDLLRLAELTGALHHLDSACGAASPWRDLMQNLLVAQGFDPAARVLYTDRFNRTYRSFAAVHRTCTVTAAMTQAGYRVEALGIVNGLIARFAG